jgi:branched-chain amino acid transport system ATP-binding protein
VLEVENVTKTFGKLTAIKGLSFSVKAGGVSGLIGPNGSGKTTMFNLISGFLKPTAGRIRLQGETITGMRPNRVAARGLVRTFQLTSVYREMTVLDSVIMGHHLCHPGASRAGQAPLIDAGGDTRRSAESIIDFMGLSDVRRTPAYLLPGGTQRTLSIATALAARPTILLLDEPLAGLNSTEKAGVIDKVIELRRRGLTMFLVEHDMKSVMTVCDQLVVINFGSKIAEGSPQQIMANPAVIEAYLGSAGVQHA